MGSLRVLDDDLAAIFSQTFPLQDDFCWEETDLASAGYAEDGGTNITATTVTNQPNGVLSLVSSGTADDLNWFQALRPDVSMGAGIDFWFMNRLKYTDAATNQMNLFIGYVAASQEAKALQAADAGPTSDFTGIGFCKLGGETAWRCVAGDGTTLNETLSTTSAGGGAWQNLKVNVQGVTATSQKVTYEIAPAGKQGFRAVRESGARTTPTQQIVHEIEAISVPLKWIVVIKPGTSVAQTAFVDHRMIRAPRAT